MEIREWLKGNTLGEDIWKNKYQNKPHSYNITDYRV